jgi:hypothetical protein
MLNPVTYIRFIAIHGGRQGSMNASTALRCVQVQDFSLSNRQKKKANFGVFLLQRFPRRVNKWRCELPNAYLILQFEHFNLWLHILGWIDIFAVIAICQFKRKVRMPFITVGQTGYVQ